jgi:hypothetical protein
MSTMIPNCTGKGDDDDDHDDHDDHDDDDDRDDDDDDDAGDVDDVSDGKGPLPEVHLDVRFLSFSFIFPFFSIFPPCSALVRPCVNALMTVRTSKYCDDAVT